jgi:predicted acetyltransferase
LLQTGSQGSLGAVPRLVLPTVEVRVSFLAAMAEFVAEGRGSEDDDSMIGREIRDFGATWHTVPGFGAYVDRLRAEALPETARPAGWVPSTTWWYTDGADYLGRIALRPVLTPGLLEVGGHIGYDVRPTTRRRGYATAMLSGVLAEAARAGITTALLTTDTDNVGSRRVIESAGGVLEDTRRGKLRFWVPTGPHI